MPSEKYPVYRPSKKEFVYVSCLSDVEFVARGENILAKVDQIIKDEENIAKMSLWGRLRYVFTV